MHHQKLYDALLSASKDKKTGQLHILGMEGKFSRSGTIIIKDGDIIKIRYMKYTGHVALDKLLAISINEVMFMTVQVIENKNNSDTPSIVDILPLLQQEEPHLNVDLQQSVQQLLESMYGVNAAKKVNTIAINTPPSTNPEIFLDKCKALAVPMFGKKKADYLFAALYEKVRIQ